MEKRKYNQRDVQDLIRRVASEEGYEDVDFLLNIARTESSYNPDAVGPQTASMKARGIGNARGLFQFIPDTAKRYGINNPHDPEEATRGAIRFLRDLDKMYGGDRVAMGAHYNGGTAVARAAKEGRAIPAETQGWLQKVLGPDYGQVQTVAKGGAARPFPTSQPATPEFVSAVGFQGNTQPFDAAVGLYQKDKAEFDKERFTAAFPAMVVSAFKNESPVYTFLTREQLRDTIDPDYNPNDPEFLKTVSEGIPDDFLPYLFQANTSAANVLRRRERLLEAMERDKLLASQGISAGFAARIVGGLADPLMLASMALPLGVARFGSRITNSAVSAAVNAGANYALDAPFMQYRPTGRPEDAIQAALFGMAFGGTAGALMRPRALGFPEVMLPRRLVEDMANTAQRKIEMDATLDRIRTMINDPQINPREVSDFIRQINDPGFANKVVQDLWDENYPIAGADQWDRFIHWARNGRTDLILLDRLERFGLDAQSARMKAFRDSLMRDIEDIENVRKKTPVVNLPRWDFQRSPDLSRTNLAEVEVAVSKFVDDFHTKGGSVADFMAKAGIDDASGMLVGSGAKSRRFVDELANDFGIVTREQLESALRKFDQRNAMLMDTEFNPRQVKGALRQMEDIIKGAELHDPVLVAMAKRLVDRLRTIDDIPTVRHKSIDRSYYDPVQHRIYLRPSAPENIVVHEVAHAVTVQAIRDARDRSGDSPFYKAFSELEDLRLAVRARYLKENPNANTRSQSDPLIYYTKNAEEFTAGLLTNDRAFMDFLRKMEIESPEGRSIVSRLWDAIKSILGFSDSEMNALRRSIQLTEQLIDAPVKRHTDFGKGDLAMLMEPYKVSEGMPMETVATVRAANEAGIPPVFGVGLGLEHRLMGKKSTGPIRDLAAKLFGTTVGFKGGGVVPQNAWDYATMKSASWSTQARKDYVPSFEAWFAAKGMKPWERDQAWAAFGEEVSNYIRGFDGEYAPEVIKAGNTLRKLMGDDIRGLINNPMADSGGVKKGLTQREYRDPETNEVKLTDPLPANPNYMPRQHDTTKWIAAVDRYGMEQVESFFATAWKRANPQKWDRRAKAMVDTTDEHAAKFAKWYINQIEKAKVNKDGLLLDDMMSGKDLDSLKMSLLDHMDSKTADDVIEAMWPTNPKDSGALTANLKFRAGLDESTTIDVRNAKTGDIETLTINDFINTDSLEVFERYARRQAGAIALAKTLDVYKMSQIPRVIEGATKNTFTNARPDSVVAKDRKLLEYAFDRIMALPENDQTVLTKSLEMWRSFNVIRLMGGAVFNQFVEWGQLVGTFGMKTVLQAVPQVGALRRSIKNGQAPSGLLDELENLTGGAGADLLLRYNVKHSDDWVRMLGDSRTSRTLDTVDTGLRKFADGVLKYTGMTGLMVQQKRLHAVAFTNHIVDVAHGKESRLFTPKRLEWMGIDQAMFDRIKENIKRFPKSIDGEFKKGKMSVDFDAWKTSDPESFHAFVAAIHRDSRRSIQENDLASHLTIMGNTWGQTMFQFQNFTFQAWNKQLLFAANHRDIATTMSLLWSSMFAAMAYLGRTHMQAQGMNEDKRRAFLEMRLDPKQFIANSVGRIGQASILPQIVDTVSPFPVFSGLRTTSDLSSFAANPTLQAINSVISMKKMIRNGVSDEYQTTDRDIKAWMRLLPLNNVLPVSAGLNAIANEFPTQEEQE